ncbi:hypothetical protein CA13_28320 [Planctomycetes bacterium CA13]|uniref:VWFA domain-containing protein n=1 Tax=Novipirellula herctigrandis TaxID=2527986 RepID=A0A5C5Z2H3_9BACT|nr:hypothetical protein CA13_28320 [Planctomycetes bacterium CA13]
MTWLDNFHFIRPLCLVLLPAVFWIVWQLQRSQDPLRGWRRIIDPTLLEMLTIGHQRAGKLHHKVHLCGLLIAVIAIAGPTFRPEPSPFADDPTPVMLLLRASESMDQSDLTPSRIVQAQLKIANFAAGRKGQPLGLIAYAGSSHLVLPPTRDTEVVASMAAEIAPNVMPKPGDDLAAALTLAEQTLSDQRGSIVIVADTSDASLSVLQEFRSQCALPIYCLAIARLDTPELDALQQAADALGATLTPMTPDNQDVERLVRSTAQMAVSPGADGEGTRWAEAGWWLVPILALFSLLSFRRVEHRKSAEELL